MEIMGLGLLGFAILSLVGILLGGLFMYFGARMADVQNATFGKGVVAGIAASVLTFLVGALVGWIPVLGWIATLVVGILAVKWVFAVSFGRAVLIWLGYFLALLIAWAVLFLLGMSLSVL